MNNALDSPLFLAKLALILKILWKSTAYSFLFGKYIFYFDQYSCFTEVSLRVVIIHPVLYSQLCFSFERAVQFNEKAAQADATRLVPGNETKWIPRMQSIIYMVI